MLLIKFRWHNHLDPQINKEPWTVEEERVVADAHRLHGNKWAEIAKLLPGRFHSTISSFFENIYLLTYGFQRIQFFFNFMALAKYWFFSYLKYLHD